MEIITDALLAIPELEDISRQFIRLCTRKLSDKFAKNKGSIDEAEIKKIIQDVGNRYGVHPQNILIVQQIMIDLSQGKLADLLTVKRR